MRKHAHKVLNLFAFSLLAFALYLNFIYKDGSHELPVPAASSAQNLEVLQDASLNRSQPTMVVENTLQNIGESKTALRASFN